MRSGAWQQGLLLYAVAAWGGDPAAAGLPDDGAAPASRPGAGHCPPGADRPARQPCCYCRCWVAEVTRASTISAPTSKTRPYLPLQNNAAAPTATACSSTRKPRRCRPRLIPELQTLRSRQAFDDMFDRAVQVATGLGWEIYLQDRNAGVIEAVDSTAIMGFRTIS